MRCGSCRHEWLVTAEWLERFDQALVGCPNCGTDCQGEDHPYFCVGPDEPLHDDAAVRDVYWYHTSKEPNWPDPDFDPTADFTDEMKRRMEAMCGTGAVERFSLRHKAKALHIGTYEAAVESMFRRMRDQGDAHSQFFLYRIELQPACVIEPGVHKEPTDWVGDAYLSEGTTVLRYVNVHEDKSSVSLAIAPQAMRAVQRITIPLAIDRSHPWIVEATQRLLEAASKRSAKGRLKLSLPMAQAPSALRAEAVALESDIVESLPFGMREIFNLEFEEAGHEACPDWFPSKLLALAGLVTDPPASLRELDAQAWQMCRAST
jgi:hypothetical protein